jgi:putative salt-induced outer membrane protein
VTSFIDGETESHVAARAAMSARIAFLPGMALTQNATAYLEPEGQTFTASTGLETRLIGALTARLSHNLQYESTRPPGQEPVDTLSRFTLVYGF